MGNSCNKVTPIVCTVRCSVTVPLWCQSAPPDKKVHPDVVEPKPKVEVQPQQAFQDEAPPAPDPAPPPAAPPATASSEAPADERKAPVELDPVEPFQPAGLVSPGAPSQRAESVIAVEPADDAAATSSSGTAQPAARKDSDTVEETNVEPLEQDEVKSKVPEEPLGVEPVDDDEAKGAASRGQRDTDADAEDLKSSTKPDTGDADTDDAQDKTTAEAEPEPSPATEEPTDPAEEEAAPSPGSEAAEVVAEADEDVSSEVEEPFTFSEDGLLAMERFQLREDAEILATRLSGQAAAHTLETICTDALDAGAAAQNCQLLLAQIRIIVHVLARAQQNGAHKVVKTLLEQLHPILETVELLVSGWSHKGTVEKFTSGRAADDEFLDVHLQLKDLAQSANFLQAFDSLPAEEASALAEEQAAQQLSGYCSVEASRAAFERLLLLFILRYKPSKTRTQKQRLMDLLAEYNSPMGAAACGCETVEEKIEHLAKARLGRAATHAVPLMVVLMTNMWGAASEDIPRGRTDKWRMAVKMALEPLRAAMGSDQLPDVPLDDAQPWEDSP